MAVEYSEIYQLAASLEKAGEARKKASAAVRRSAFAIEARAKQAAPVDTGNLRNSISTTSSGLSAEIGPTASYGIYLEMGTWRMAPRSYLTPAFKATVPEFVSAMDLIAKEAI